MSKRKIFAILVSVVFTGVLAYFYVQFQSQPSAPKIMIAKNEAYDFYANEDLVNLSKRLSDQRFSNVSDFTKQPYVERAVVSKSLSGQTRIKVYLQKPVMAFFINGTYKLLDKSGSIFSEVPQYKIPNLPIIRGELFQAKKNRKKAVDFYLNLEDQGLLSKKTLSEVLIEEDLELIFSGVKGRVFIGEQDLQNRIERTTKVIKYLRFHGLEAKKIDARFRDRVVVSLIKNKIS